MYAIITILDTMVKKVKHSIGGHVKTIEETRNE